MHPVHPIGTGDSSRFSSFPTPFFLHLRIRQVVSQLLTDDIISYAGNMLL